MQAIFGRDKIQTGFSDLHALQLYQLVKAPTEVRAYSPTVTSIASSLEQSG